MNLLLIGSASLKPYLEQLSAATDHRIRMHLLAGSPSPHPDAVGAAIAHATDCDAILLPDGASVIPDEGLTAGAIPLILPRVHHILSLLQGIDSYRHFWARYDGKLCYRLPGDTPELYVCPKAECQALCYLADTELALPDASLSARIIAQHQGWDYLEAAADLTLLTRLLSGDWADPNLRIVPPGETLTLNYRRNLFD